MHSVLESSNADLTFRSIAEDNTGLNTYWYISILILIEG